MEKISAYAAIGVSLLIAGLVIYAWATDSVMWTAWLMGLLVSLVLVFGGVQTLWRASGGMRLLAGAWGILVGFAVMGLVAVTSPEWMFTEPMQPPRPTDRYWAAAIVAATVGGLALVVAHKEKK